MNNFYNSINDCPRLGRKKIDRNCPVINAYGIKSTEIIPSSMQTEENRPKLHLPRLGKEKSDSVHKIVLLKNY